MYLHNDDKELFHDVVMLTSQKLGISDSIVEKDYYVTEILRKMSGCRYHAVFKGGTSLSKAFHIINRFSEDIDISFKEHLGEAKHKNLKYKVIKPIGEELNLEIRNFNFTESDKDLNHYDFCYEPVVDDSGVGNILSCVKLETSLMSYSFPTQRMKLSSYIFTALEDEERELVEAYNLGEFEMDVQSMSRTMIDKLFAICEYYLQGKDHRNSRHLYDIYKLSECVDVDDEFVELAEKVRSHRMQIGARIAPSASVEINIPELAHKLCNEDFYMEDYRDTTLNLISSYLSYEEAVNRYIEVIDAVFG